MVDRGFHLTPGVPAFAAPGWSLSVFIGGHPVVEDCVRIAFMLGDFAAGGGELVVRKSIEETLAEHFAETDLPDVGGAGAAGAAGVVFAGGFEQFRNSLAVAGDGLHDFRSPAVGAMRE